jgi:nitrate reductase beta subunit
MFKNGLNDLLNAEDKEEIRKKIREIRSSKKMKTNEEHEKELKEKTGLTTADREAIKRMIAEANGEPASIKNLNKNKNEKSER